MMNAKMFFIVRELNIASFKIQNIIKIRSVIRKLEHKFQVALLNRRKNRSLGKPTFEGIEPLFEP